MSDVCYILRHYSPSGFFFAVFKACLLIWKNALVCWQMRQNDLYCPLPSLLFSALFCRICNHSLFPSLSRTQHTLQGKCCFYILYTELVSVVFVWLPTGILNLWLHMTGWKSGANLSLNIFEILVPICVLHCLIALSQRTVYYQILSTWIFDAKNLYLLGARLKWDLLLSCPTQKIFVHLVRALRFLFSTGSNDRTGKAHQDESCFVFRTRCWSLDTIKRDCCLVILYLPGLKCEWRNESSCWAKPQQMWGVQPSWFWLCESLCVSCRASLHCVCRGSPDSRALTSAPASPGVCRELT